MPDHVVWQTVDRIPSNFREFRKAFGFDLVIYWLYREIDAYVVSQRVGQGTQTRDKNDTFAMDFRSD